MLWLTRGWRMNYEATVVGQESGTVTLLPFVRFTTEDEAKRWCDYMNQRDRETALGSPLTLFGYRGLRRDSPDRCGNGPG